MPIGHGNDGRNVSSQRRDETSLLTLYHDLLALRKRSPVLQSGNLTLHDGIQTVLMYERTLGVGRMLIMLNLSVDSQQIVLPRKEGGWYHLFSTKPGDVVVEGAETLHLAPQEGAVLA